MNPTDPTDPTGSGSAQDPNVTQVESAAAAEFDAWAQRGRGESMAQGHRSSTAHIVQSWSFEPDSVALDVGCGNGWAVRWMIERGAPRACGVDISPEMVARARAQSPDAAWFGVSSGERLPFPTAGTHNAAAYLSLPVSSAGFSHVLSVESLYYYADPGRALDEWARVARPGARLGIMVDLYAENLGSHAWVDALPVAVHLMSKVEYAQLAQTAGWKDVRTRQVRDPRPAKPESEFTPSTYWPSYAQYLAYRDAGSLLVEAVR